LSPREQEQALQEIKRVLKATGVVFLSVWIPTLEYIQAQQKKKKWNYVKENIARVLFTMENKQFERYYYMFKILELKKLISKVGFKIISEAQEDGNYFLKICLG
jgi:ubiquinone/menaquinone biosynthesis C-methylase UbiE